MAEIDLRDIERRMDGALEALNREFGGLRTGRASPALLDPLTVDAYGSQMPLNQVGTVNAPEARLLTVQVWWLTISLILWNGEGIGNREKLQRSKLMTGPSPNIFTPELNLISTVIFTGKAGSVCVGLANWTQALAIKRIRKQPIPFIFGQMMVVGCLSMVKQSLTPGSPPGKKIPSPTEKGPLN